MRILVGWDDLAEAELLTLYLGLDDAHEVAVAATREELRQQAQTSAWDICLLSLSLPDADTAFAAFQDLRETVPGCPVVGGCQGDEMLQLAKYLVRGMRGYVVRDANRDFLFLLRATLESIHEAVKAERAKQLVERLREEIEAVRKLQEAILPSELYSPRGYHLCARHEPSSSQAGGDYYDVFPIDESNVVVLIGDASGPGMKACLSLVAMHTLVRLLRGQQYRHTATFMAEVNNRLCEQQLIRAEGGFITLLYGILHTDRHEFQWTSAGHPLPLLHNLATGDTRLIGARDSAGPPLGVFPETAYESGCIALPPHHRLLLHTDGLTDLANVEATLRRSTGLSLEAATAALFDGQGRQDDASAVMIERPLS